jgi:hypothetical protein
MQDVPEFEQVAREAAEAHPKPFTEGLDITETDTKLIRLYRDVRESQLTLHQLRALPEDQLFWLAGHLERPAVITDAEWEKLRANGWRARVVVEQQTQDRAEQLRLEFQRKENGRNRLVQILVPVVAVILGFLAGRFAANGPTEVPQPLIVEVQSSVLTPAGSPDSLPTTTGP